jgi:hypothetical protein
MAGLPLSSRSNSIFPAHYARGRGGEPGTGFRVAG